MLGSGNYVSGPAQPLHSTLETWDSREMAAMKCAGRNPTTQFKMRHRGARPHTQGLALSLCTPREGLGWEEQDATLAKAHWQPCEASAQPWGGLSSQFFSVPDVSESVPTSPVGHGQVSVSSLPQGPAWYRHRESERVSRSVSERQNPCHTKRQQSPKRACPFSLAQWETPGSMYCPPQQLRPRVARAGSPLGCSPRSGGFSGPRKGHCTPTGVSTQETGAQCLWKAGWQSLLRLCQEASWSRRHPPEP